LDRFGSYLFFNLPWFGFAWFRLVLVVWSIKDNAHNWFVCLVDESSAHNLVVWFIFGVDL